MVERVEWLKLQVHGRPGRLPRALLTFLTFEAYYQLCALLGSRPRHVLLDSSPESLRAHPACGARHDGLASPAAPDPCA